MKCKFCGSQESSLQSLRDHWQTDHFDAYVAVQQFLGEVDEKDMMATKIAAEGMKGYGEKSDVGKR